MPKHNANDPLLSTVEKLPSTDGSFQCLSDIDIDYISIQLIVDGNVPNDVQRGIICLAVCLDFRDLFDISVKFI